MKLATGVELTQSEETALLRGMNRSRRRFLLKEAEKAYVISTQPAYEHYTQAGQTNEAWASFMAELDPLRRAYDLARAQILEIPSSR